jgi:hypothetical protein
MKKRCAILALLLVLPIVLILWIKETRSWQPRSVGISFPDISGFIRFTKDSREIAFGSDYYAFGEYVMPNLNLFRVSDLTLKRDLPLDQIKNTNLFAAREPVVKGVHAKGFTTFQIPHKGSIRVPGNFSAGRFSPDEKFLAAILNNREIALFEVKTKRLSRRLAHKTDIHSYLFAPNSSTLAVLTWHNLILWRIQ